MINPLDVQVGGKHYKQFKIQPVELYNQFKLGFGEANVIKYSMRHQSKNGAEDLNKVLHYVDLMIQFNNPIGKFIPMEYIEKFIYVNHLNAFHRSIIEEISFWLLNRSPEHLLNVKHFVKEELKLRYNR